MRRRPPDGVDEREPALQQISAADHLGFGAVRFGKAQRGGFERGGPEIIGGRVDEVARQRDTLRDDLDAARIDTGGRDETRRLRPGGLFIGAESVRAEQPGERRGGGIGRRRCESVGARRQHADEVGAQKGIARIRLPPLQREDDRAERAVRRGQQQVAAGLGGEIQRVPMAFVRRAQPGAQGGGRLRRDEVNRDRASGTSEFQHIPLQCMALQCHAASRRRALTDP